MHACQILLSNSSVMPGYGIALLPIFELLAAHYEMGAMLQDYTQVHVHKTRISNNSCIGISGVRFLQDRPANQEQLRQS